MRAHMMGLWVLVALGLGVAAFGVTPTAQTRRYTYEQITVSSSAVAVSATTVAGMGQCQLRLETNPIRYRMDATAPTASVGMPMTAGDVMDIGRAEDVAAMRFIAQSSDATLNVLCWPQP